MSKFSGYLIFFSGLCTKQLIKSELVLVLWREKWMGSVLPIYKELLSVCLYVCVQGGGISFIISSSWIVIYERDGNWLNNKSMPVSCDQDGSWSTLMGKPKMRSIAPFHFT